MLLDVFPEPEQTEDKRTLRERERERERVGGKEATMKLACLPARARRVNFWLVGGAYNNAT